MKLLFLFLSIVLAYFLVTFPAQASICQTYNNQEICIIKIKRSAKYHWRYRTQISIDGKKQSQKIYDCHQRQIIEKNHSFIPFAEDGIEQFICQTLNK